MADGARQCKRPGWNTYTIKGIGLPFQGHKDNHAGLMTATQIEAWRTRTAMEPQGFFRPMTIGRRDSIIAFYERAALAMFHGQSNRMIRYAASADPAKKRIAELFQQAGN